MIAKMKENVNNYRVTHVVLKFINENEVFEVLISYILTFAVYGSSA